MTRLFDSFEDLHRAMAAGSLTSEALVSEALERIAAADARLGAFVEVFDGEARDAARALDRELAAGRSRGPLHGIPLALKDLVDIAGVPTSCGSVLMEGHVAPRDAVIVRRLARAGAIIIGKTRMTELAFGGWGTNAVAGTPRNPWRADAHYVPGGSSSGAAAAVAAGFAGGAIGTDTGGSVRIPAALCGLVGLKSTAGRIPRDGLHLLSPTLDTVGPLARRVRDAGVIYRVLADLAPTEINLSRLLNARLAVLPDAALEGLDDAVATAYAAAVDMFRRRRVTFAPLDLGHDPQDYVALNGLIIAAEGWRIWGERIEAGQARMDPAVVARFSAGRDVSDAQHRQALEERRRLGIAVQDQLMQFTGLLTPATPIPAVPLADVDETRLPLNRFTRMANFLGLTGIAVPAAISDDGLPVAVQFLGNPGMEDTLLALGAAFEQFRGPLPPPDLSGYGL